MQLNSSLDEIKGVGPKTAEALAARGFQTFKDLLYYFPRKYEDYAAYTKISEIRPGKVVVRGKIRGLRNIHTRRRNFTITQGEIFDETGALRVVWYNQAYRIKNFKEDTEYYFTGEYDFKYNRYQLTSPTAVLASEVEESRQDGDYQPIYSGSGRYNSAWYRRNCARFFIKFPNFCRLRLFRKPLSNSNVSKRSLICIFRNLNRRSKRLAPTSVTRNYLN